MSAILQTVELRKAFGAIVVADGLTVSIRRQSVVGIIGANGAGKTTFVNMITGYITPSSGRILFNGRDITGLNPIEIVRGGIGRSFQVAQLFNGLTAYENMLLSLGIADRGRHGMLCLLEQPERVAACESALREFGIERYLDYPMQAVPQGARKLLDIAMALAARPHLLLLDEPTSGVSTKEKMALMDQVMSAVRAAGSTAILIEHDMEIIRRYADSVLAFAQGRICCEGTPDQVLNDPFVRSSIIGD